MMEWLVSIFTSSGLGAITGLLGGWLSKREARKSKAQDQTHAQAMANINKEVVQASQAHALELADKNIEASVTQGKTEIEKSELMAFIQSIKEQGRPTGNKWVDGAKSMVRPAITFWLMYQLGKISAELTELTGGFSALPVADQLALFMVIVDAIVFLTTTAVGWWFASRRGQV